MIFLALYVLLKASTALASIDTASSLAACSASSFANLSIAGAKVSSLTANWRSNVTGGVKTFGTYADLEFCEVNVHLTHPGVDDDVLISVWLPPTDEAWNGRFQATGGGGWATGMFDHMLGPAVQKGYAVASTDGGHEHLVRPAARAELPWTLKDDKTVNWGLLQNFLTRSLADQVHVGKDIVEMYYGKKPHHSYWNGCSMGGRQGYMMAQKYPHLLDGILANAPGINFVDILMGAYWPQIAMQEAGTLMTNCEFKYFVEKAVADCDLLDGVQDGVIADPEACTFDPKSLVGDKIECDGKDVEITKAMAAVVRKIEEGPRTRFGTSLWHGLPLGTSATGLANITISSDGSRYPAPFQPASGFIRYLLLKDPSFNLTTLTAADYTALWAQANKEYAWFLNADQHDLSTFRAAGGKLLSWHGMADPFIPYHNTVKYRQRVEFEHGVSTIIDDFYRLFLVPGVEHCHGGAGAVPTDPLSALVDWVENDEPPDTLDASTTDAEGERVTRSICRYPRKPKYMGIGDAKRASSWSCEGGEEPELDETLDDASGFLGGFKDRLKGLGMPGLKIQ